MSEIGSTSPAAPVRHRADRRRVNRIAVDAYLLAAQKERERKARKTNGRVRDVSQLDRVLITPSTVISTWIASAQGVLYLLGSGEATVQIRRRHQLGAVALRFVLPLLVPGLVLDMLVFVAPATYELVTLLLLIYGLAVLLAMAVVIACTLVRVLWMRQLRPKRARASFRTERPSWVVTDLASVQRGPAIALVDEVIATINAVVPAKAKVGAKARDKALFRIYERYLTPVDGSDNLALTGIAPLHLPSDEDLVTSDSPVSSTSSELERRK